MVSLPNKTNNLSVMKIGVDLGGTNIRVGMVDNDEIVKMYQAECPSKESAEFVLDILADSIDKVLDNTVESIGIGVPSIVDSVRGIVYDVVNIPSWKEVHLKSVMENKFKVPVHVNNDANCFALGESLVGNAKGMRDMVGITLGTGLGVGVIINGHLYGGTNTCAGEIGFVPYLDSDYEHYCSGLFFKEKCPVDAKTAFLRAKEGDRPCLEMWNMFGKHFASFIKLILLAYDPQIIVLGGSVASAFDFFKHSMYEELNDFPYKKVSDGLNITTCSKEYISIFGASALE